MLPLKVSRSRFTLQNVDLSALNAEPFNCESGDFRRLRDSWSVALWLQTPRDQNRFVIPWHKQQTSPRPAPVGTFRDRRHLPRRLEPCTENHLQQGNSKWFCPKGMVDPTIVGWHKNRAKSHLAAAMKRAAKPMAINDLLFRNVAECSWMQPLSGYPMAWNWKK